MAIIARVHSERVAHEWFSGVECVDARESTHNYGKAHGCAHKRQLRQRIDYYDEYRVV